MFTGCIPKPINVRFAILREDYINFCDGDKCSAMLISYFEYWHNIKMADFLRIQSIKGRSEFDGPIPESKLTQHQSLKEIELGILGEYKRSSIIVGLRLLEEKGVLEITDRGSINGLAKTYLFNPTPINNFNNHTDLKTDRTDLKTNTTNNKETERTVCKGKDSLQTEQPAPAAASAVLKRRTRMYPSFPTDTIGDIFAHWNYLAQVPSHKIDQQSKVFIRAVKTIQTTLQKYSVAQIKEAMDTYNAILVEPNTKLNGQIGCVVSLPEFFKFSSFTEGKLEEYVKNGGDNLFPFDSWFSECLKGKEHLVQLFAKYETDNYPKTTETIKTTYLQEINSKHTSVSDINNYIRAAKKMLQYHSANKNKINWNSCLREKDNPTLFAKRLIAACLDSANKDASIINSGWLSSDKMFSDRLPRYLRKIGLLAEGTKNAGLNTSATKSIKKGYDPGYTKGEIE